MSNREQALADHLWMEPLGDGETWKDRVFWPHSVGYRSGKPTHHIGKHWDDSGTTLRLRSELRELAGAQEDMLIAAFVHGAKWWEYHKEGATMWQSDQHKVCDAAQEHVRKHWIGSACLCGEGE